MTNLTMVEGYLYVTKGTINTTNHVITYTNTQDLVDIEIGSGAGSSGTVKHTFNKTVNSIPIPVSKGSRDDKGASNKIIDLKRIVETIIVDGSLVHGVAGISGDNRKAIEKKNQLRYILGATDYSGTYTAGTFYIGWKHGSISQAYQVNATKVDWVEDADLELSAGDCKRMKIMAQFMVGEDR